MSEDNVTKKMMAEKQAEAQKHLQQAKANMGEVLKLVNDEEMKQKWEGLVSLAAELISKM